MRNWHSLYEILQFPIGVLIFAVFMLGLGNLIVNPLMAGIFGDMNPGITALASVMIRTGTFVVANFPILLLIRVVTRKAGSGTSIISALCGYVTYLAVTMSFASANLPGTAYSAILGFSSTGTALAGSVRYPLQTGIVATIVIAIVTLGAYQRTRRHSEYGIFGFISKDVWCVVQTVLLSGLAAFVVTLIWPFFVQIIQDQISFISSDTTNPINLMMYGIMDRLLSVLNLNTMLRSPFWYGANGGSWINMAGVNVAGDVSIWTAQLANSALTGMAGRFITPYYVLNMFAVPGLLWGMFSVLTDRMERRRSIMYFIGLTLMSWCSGVLLPLELMLLLACPLLFVMHVAFTGILFGALQAMHVYLGFNYTGIGTMTVQPGTLVEYLGYLQNPSLRTTQLTLLIVGVVAFIVYFLFTRFYYRHLALDLFRTGERKRLVDGVIKCVGGTTNIKMINASTTKLTIALYDPTKLDINRLLRLGSVRVHESKAGYVITFGAASTMIRLGIVEEMRNTIRSSSI